MPDDMYVCSALFGHSVIMKSCYARERPGSEAMNRSMVGFYTLHVWAFVVLFEASIHSTIDLIFFLVFFVVFYFSRMNSLSML